MLEDFEMLGLARSDDPETSQDAAQCKFTGITKAIYDIHMAFGHDGCIMDEVLANLPNTRISTITPRFVQMIQKGILELTGKKRKGLSGRQQLVRRALSPPFAANPTQVRYGKFRRCAGCVYLKGGDVDGLQEER
jgi:hypothetical protein